jgi:hypothetical protein
LSETENHLVTANDLGYIAGPLYRRGRELRAEVDRLLDGYIDFLKRHKPGITEPGHDINVGPLLSETDTPADDCSRPPSDYPIT